MIKALRTETTVAAIDTRKITEWMAQWNAHIESAKHDDPPVDIEIPPYVVDDLLETMIIGNRKPSKSNVTRMMKALRAPKGWDRDGSLMQVDWNGKLINCGNRLMACKQSNRPLRTWVKFACDPELFSKLDAGKNRTVADDLYHEQYSYHKEKSSALKWIYWYEHKFKHRPSLERPEALKLIKKYSAELDKVAEVAKKISKLITFPIGQTMAVLFEINRLNPHYARMFMQDLEDPMRWNKRAPIVKKMIAPLTKDRQLGHRIRDYRYFNSLVTAWNNYITKGERASAGMFDIKLMNEPWSVPMKQGRKT